MLAAQQSAASYAAEINPLRPISRGMMYWPGCIWPGAHAGKQIQCHKVFQPEPQNNRPVWAQSRENEMTELNTSKLVYEDDEVRFTGKRYSRRKSVGNGMFWWHTKNKNTFRWHSHYPRSDNAFIINEQKTGKRLSFYWGATTTITNCWVLLVNKPI